MIEEMKRMDNGRRAYNNVFYNFVSATVGLYFFIFNFLNLFIGLNPPDRRNEECG
jgi:hypothetical protein